jgi:hypothetical protein
MNRLGLLNNRSPCNEFSAIDGDSLTDGEISWEDKVENDIYLHAMLDFVNRGKQRHQAVPLLFQRAVTRPIERKPGFWDAFFPKEERECPIPAVIYIEHESTTTTPYKKQKYIEHHYKEDAAYDCTDRSVSPPGSVATPSLRSEPWTVPTTPQLCEEDVVEILGLNRIGQEHWNGQSSYFTEIRAPDAPNPHPWEEDKKRHQLDKMCGVEYLNFGYF